MRGRLYSLDIARGLASLSVVIWHWQHFFFVGNHLPEGFQRNSQPFYSVLFPFYERGGSLAVAFFFLLSGYVFFWLYRDSIASRAVSLGRFFQLRFARLYPLHFATLLAVAYLQYLYFAQNHSFFVYPFNDLYHFILNLFFMSDWGFELDHSFNAPIWSVSLEVGLYLFFALLVYFRQATWWKLLPIVMTAMFYQKWNHGGRWAFAIEAFFLGGLTFYALQFYRNHRKRSTDAAIVLVTAWLWLSTLVSPRAEHLLLDKYHLHLLVLFPLTIASLVLLELRYEGMGRRWAWIGDMTYSTYLLQFPLQLVFVLVAGALGLGRDVFLSPYVFLLYFAILIPAAQVTYHWFERPVQDWIRNFRMVKLSPLAPGLEKV